GLFRELNDPLLIGQRSLARVGNSDTTANLNVLIEDTTQLTTSDYEVEFTNATDYTVRRVSDGTSFGPFDITVVPAAEFDGISLNVASGTFAAGDRFRVMPTRNAGESIRADMKRPEELAFAAPLKSQTSPANIGTGVISQPTLLTEIDIYDPVAQADLETSLRNAPPRRIVMGAGGGGTQG
ncbi:flagellar hook-associated protein FlgK, partial [Myxococcus sp. AM001]|nr:flagellar hook-associated protein FlgK [Myxococcus sp. AM001]